MIMKLDKRITKMMMMSNHYDLSTFITGVNDKYLCMQLMNDIFMLLPLGNKDTFYYWDNFSTLVYLYNGYFVEYVNNLNEFKDIHKSIVKSL